MSLCCNDDMRRDAVRRLKGWNGLDYVEVGPDQRSLTVYFLGKLPRELQENRPGLEQYLSVEGGERIKHIQVVDIDPIVSDDPERDDPHRRPGQAPRSWYGCAADAPSAGARCRR